VIEKFEKMRINF